MMKVKHYAHLEKMPQVPQKEAVILNPVSDKFAFRTNSYYNSLIDWNNPADPLRQVVIPNAEELIDWGILDASNEADYQPVAGVEHKYRSTALLLCNDVCAAYCRFCFRKRLFQQDNDEVVKDVSVGVEYIRNHPEITNVLLTGGDPMVMSTGKLEKIIRPLSEIEHVEIIRVGTKIPAFNPYRILNDPSLPEMIITYSKCKQLFIMAHYNHPTELTDVSVAALKQLMKAGATVVNQTPIIRGVNDDAQVLSRLFSKLSSIGVLPYYVFACRPTEGNKIYAVPVEEAYQLYEASRVNLAGLAKTARFIMSHKSGKLEIVGMTETLVFIKSHNIVDVNKNNTLMTYKRNPEAYWFDDYEGLQIEI